MQATRTLIQQRRAKKQSTIKTTQRGTVTKRNMQRVVKRQSERLNYEAMSYNKVLRDAKTKGHFLGTTATQVAIRFAKNELMASIMNVPLAPRQKRLIEKLVISRDLKIPGTNISSSRPTSLIFMELVNTIGEKKTRLILEKLVRRAKAIQRLNVKNQRTGKYKSEIFNNVGSNVGRLSEEFELEIENKPDLVNRINGFITQRRGDIALLEQSSILNKEFYIKKLRQQQRDAIMQRTDFQSKNDIPF